MPGLRLQLVALKGTGKPLLVRSHQLRLYGQSSAGMLNLGGTVRTIRCAVHRLSAPLQLALLMVLAWAVARYSSDLMFSTFSECHELSLLSLNRKTPALMTRAFVLRALENATWKLCSCLLYSLPSPLPGKTERPCASHFHSPGLRRWYNWCLLTEARGSLTLASRMYCKK